MKIKILLGVLFVVGVLVGLGATTVFAQGPAAATTTVDNQTWQQMHQACVNGDFQTMQQLHNQVWGGNVTAGGPGGCFGGYNNGVIPGTTQGTTGWRGMMSNIGGMMGRWFNNGTAPQNPPATGGTSYRWGGMMGGRGGMMGSW